MYEDETLIEAPVVVGFGTWVIAAGKDCVILIPMWIFIPGH